MRSSFYPLLKQVKATGIFTIIPMANYSANKPNIISFNVPHYGTPLTVSDWITPLDINKKDNFCGVDRNLDRARLAGNIANSSEYIDIVAAIIHTQHLVNREGGMPSFLFIPSYKYEEYQKNIRYGSKAINNNITTTQTIYGAIKILPANTKDMYLLHPDDWINIVDQNGNHLTLVCKNPGHQGRIILEAESEFECTACGALEVGHNVFKPCKELED